MKTAQATAVALDSKIGMAVEKRSGELVPYNVNKIIDAVAKALGATGEVPSSEVSDAALHIAYDVTVAAQRTHQVMVTIEWLQDQVEKMLMAEGYTETAKAFILYRKQRMDARQSEQELTKVLDEIILASSMESDLKRGNANVDGNSSMGTMLQIGAAAAKQYYTTKFLKPAHASAHREGLIHIHDFDFYSLTTTCCQIDIDKLLSSGFSTGHGFIRRPSGIRVAAALTCIAIQSNQNDQHGGQSIPNFDYALGKYVRLSYVKHFWRSMDLLIKGVLSGALFSLEEIKAAFAERGGVIGLRESKDMKHNRLLAEVIASTLGKSEKSSLSLVSTARTQAHSDTEDETYQAMEAFVHNMNSMHSRAGAQVPFSSINYGTDTSTAGRMVTRCLLKATQRGLGNGETPIFPIQIFKLKAGVNYNFVDPNFDLFELACKTSAKRLFPNFSNLDAPFNLQYYQAGKPETEVATMGCRTRVMGNVYAPDKEVAFGRGNLSFTSINLPRIALDAGKDEATFYRGLDAAMTMVAQQLLDRYYIQAKKTVRNFPFLMGQGVWLDSEQLNLDSPVGEVLKHGTLSIGFIGLAEALIVLCGEHHGESDLSHKKGVEIISHMNDFCVNLSKAKQMNFTLLATPAEGLSGRFVRIDREKYGHVSGVTDKEYYTNSFHIPVGFPISAYEKIQKEAPFHALTPAGHITYVELDGDIVQNPEAFMAIIRCMHDAGIGYGSVNHPVDRDPVCGYVGVINDVCPRCGRKEGEPISAAKLEDIRKRYLQYQ